MMFIMFIIFIIIIIIILIIIIIIIPALPRPFSCFVFHVFVLLLARIEKWTKTGPMEKNVVLCFVIFIFLGGTESTFDFI